MFFSFITVAPEEYGRFFVHSIVEAVKIKDSSRLYYVDSEGGVAVVVIVPLPVLYTIGAFTCSCWIFVFIFVVVSHWVRLKFSDIMLTFSFYIPFCKCARQELSLHSFVFIVVLFRNLSFSIRLCYFYH